MKVIIFGTGKAALLHYEKYKKFIADSNIFFVNPYETSWNKKVYKNLGELLAFEKLFNEKVLADICTPHLEFESIIKDCLAHNINNILVEKPFLLTNILLENPQLNLAMVRNYLFSKLTAEAMKIIEEENLIINKVHTNFSKNRRKESIEMRGMGKEAVTSCLEVEIPHQIYLVNFFLKHNDYAEQCEVECEDMPIDNGFLKNHGRGCIMYSKSGIKVHHESDLMAEGSSRKIRIYTQSGKIIEMNYLIFGEKYNVLKQGSISMLHNDQVIYQKQYSDDDNVLEFLKYIYNVFITENRDKIELERNVALRFSREMNGYLLHLG